VLLFVPKSFTTFSGQKAAPNSLILAHDRRVGDEIGDFVAGLPESLGK
jgi:hypothetical protein